MGAEHLPLDLSESAAKGETLHQLTLDGATQSTRVKLTDVLSEGEQRVVALAGFLAELSLGQHSCPIVLDDPVGSLDHLFREKIAGRLVAESRSRQVIVFTHDIAFLLELKESARNSRVAFSPQTILRESKDTGIPNEGLPWQGMPVDDRLRYLRCRLRKTEASYSADRAAYDSAAAYIYGLLRETWEAAVEEVIFARAVVRHGSKVNTTNLIAVALTTDQYKAIRLGIGRCSKWIAGHDKSRRLDSHRPPPEEIGEDIETLCKFVGDCKKARKALQKERKAALDAVSAPIG